MNKTIEELADRLVRKVCDIHQWDVKAMAIWHEWFSVELTKAYEAGQVEMGKWVLYENTGGRAGIQNKIEDIAATLKAKTDI